VSITKSPTLLRRGISASKPKKKNVESESISGSAGRTKEISIEYDLTATALFGENKIPV